LNVRLRDYKRLGPEWDGRFDAVIANGSLEHFAQPADAAAGRDDEIYHHLFATVHRLLDPDTPGARFVTTAIHFRNRPDPRDLMQPPSAFAWGSEAFHWSRLAHSFGGWYPVRGQLEACAAGYFELIHEEDGTEDYRRTSEAWLSGARERLWSARVFLAALLSLAHRPVQTVLLLRCLLGSESWNWQFRGHPSPALLLRQTWERVD
jgi:cyclopropane fatty-acyl-phospholipid synthase-like methyltransferase